MIILSNDYAANLPGAQKKAQGGPKIFAKIFSRHAVARGHQWVGVVMRGSERRGGYFKNIPYTKKCIFVEAHYDAKLTRRLLRTKKYMSADVLLAPIIQNFSTLIKKKNADIVFLNGFDVMNWVLMKAAFSAKIPIAMQHAGIWKKEIHIHAHLYTPAVRKILYKMERDISRYADHEVFLSGQSLEAYNKEVTRVNKGKISIIPAPCESLVYHKKPKKKKSYAIGIVARWDRIKNHEAVLRLAKRAKEKELPWKFYAVTSIPETPKRKEFKKEYREFISVEQQRDRKALTRFYRKMDLMILPSHFDVSPFVVIEAAMEGTATLISPNVGHADEYKKSGAEEWIIDFSDPEKVIRRIKKVIAKPIPKKLVHSFEKSHDPKTVSEQYLALFERVMNNY